MIRKNILSLLLAGCGTVLLPLYGDPPDQEIRTIRLLQDDGQTRMVSKFYELKHVKATDIRPFIQAAVKRYSKSSIVERVYYFKAKKHAIIVSTGDDFIPYVDDLIAGLDQPGKPDQYGSTIEGTGVTRITYRPNYRAADDILRLINDGTMRTPEGRAYLNKDTNTIYWKDDRGAALDVLNWVRFLDCPVPQVSLKLNYYEIRESKLRDIGLDYLAWKNGPGMDIFSAGFNGGKIFSNEAIFELINGFSKLADLTSNFSSSWGYGAFFTAPQFDMSFIRILQQSGNARLAAQADLTMVNTPIYELDALNKHLPKTYSVTLTPDYENFQKDSNDRTEVTVGGDSTLTLQVTNPVVCFGPESRDTDPQGKLRFSEEFYRRNRGNMIFSYKLNSKTVTERSNRGDELGNNSTVSGELTLGFKTEKILTQYVREQEAEQTIGIPFLVKIPILKYLFGTVTSIKERTYIVVTAEAGLIDPGPLDKSKVNWTISSGPVEKGL